MKNKFALSFGVSLIIVGILNVFLDANSIILFGLSISSFIFSIINIIFSFFSENEKLELIYIIPFIILLAIFCYSDSLLKLNVIKTIINSEITSVLTFVSFGFLFVSEYINHQNYLTLERIKHYSIITESLKYSNAILKKMIDYRQSMNKSKKAISKESENFLTELENLCLEKSKLAKIEIELLNSKKNNFNLDDFTEVYNNEITKSSNPLKPKNKKE